MTREAWAFKLEAFHGPFPSWRAAWDYLTTLDGPDGYVLGPTDAAFCRAWIGDARVLAPVPS